MKSQNYDVIELQGNPVSKANYENADEKHFPQTKTSSKTRKRNKMKSTIIESSN